VSHEVCLSGKEKELEHFRVIASMSLRDIQGNGVWLSYTTVLLYTFLSIGEALMKVP
jgi:hypothetical protein